MVVGKVGSHSYAFVGLERVGGIMIYDITNPNEPYFVKYLYDPDNKDISPEGITFESAEESPNGKPMLIASFELSGTTSAWELEDLTGDQESDDGEDSDNREIPTGSLMMTIQRLTHLLKMMVQIQNMM